MYADKKQQQIKQKTKKQKIYAGNEIASCHEVGRPPSNQEQVTNHLIHFKHAHFSHCSICEEAAPCGRQGRF